VSFYEVVDLAHPEDPVREMEASAGLLADVSSGRRGPTARVYRPGPTVAFGRLDELLSGYGEARRRAAAAGFAPVRRLGGGRAAAYHRGSVLFDVLAPEASIAAGIEERFERVTAAVAEVLAGLGLPVAIGQLAGEFCPGRFSIHAGGRKLAGIAQRAVRGASLVTGFVSVEREEELREVLVAVYDALGLELDPATVGAADALLPGLRAAAVAAALERRLAAAGAGG